MWTIFWQTIKDKKIAIIIYILASVAFMWMYIAMYPSIQTQAEQFKEAFKAYPQDLFKAMNIEEMNFDTLEKFLAMEEFSLIWPIIMIFMTASIAAGAIAGEIDKGTVEIILSKPISRVKIFFAKYLSGASILLLFVAATVFAIVPLAELHNASYDLEKYAKLALIGFLFGLAIFSLSMMCSAIFSERGRVYMFIGGLLILMYVFNIIAKLKDNLKDLEYLSFFYYYNQNKSLIHNEIDLTAIIVFACVIIVSTIIGAYVFHKRDIAV